VSGGPVVFIADPAVSHDPGVGHPESPRRLEVVLDEVQAAGLTIRTAPVADRETLVAVHPESYLAMLEALAGRGGGVLDPDTVMGPASWLAAVGGVGAVLAGVSHALRGDGPAFAAVRPPGHHCLADRAMGFCLLANVVIGARAAQRAGCQRILILDWDVHHGNGTQALVERDPAIRFVSMHQDPWWPGTGAASERGVGNIFNIPRPAGLAPDRYIADLWTGIESATAGWPPDLILISAGFDSMHGDPLGGFTLEPEHFAEVTTRLRTAFPTAPMVSSLEGGYAPRRLAAGVLAHLGAMQ